MVFFWEAKLTREPLEVSRPNFHPEEGAVVDFYGVVREIEVLTDCDATLLADRRSRGPWGLSGGREGAPGSASIQRQDGSTEPMPGKFSTRLRKGERITINTPGGGGLGK